MYYPVNHFPRDVIHKIGQGIACFTATNRDQLLGGDTFERIVSESLGVPYVKGTNLCDVKSGYQGWSVKVRYVDDPQTAEFVDLKLTTRFPKESIATLSPEEIAGVYLSIWKDIVSKTQETCFDLRTLILLNERSHRTFALYEYQTHYWDVDDFLWKWSSDQKTSIHGYTACGEKQFSIHLNDSRLFVREKIGERQTCKLHHAGFLETHVLAKLIGFTPQSVIPLPKAHPGLMNTLTTQILQGVSRITRSKKPQSQASLAALFMD